MRAKFWTIEKALPDGKVLIDNLSPVKSEAAAECSRRGPEWRSVEIELDVPVAGGGEQKANHATTVHSLDGQAHQARKWYVACSCGYCGPVRNTSSEAGADGSGHLAANAEARRVGRGA